MRKPTELRPEADLQAIQTSVAFNKIADAIEQYRRQFGLVFLSLVAFSAVHVGLVVVANLYTQQTRVHKGMLIGTSVSENGDSVHTPVATAAAQQQYDIPFIMSSLPTDQQRKMLTSLKTVNFVDSAGDFRQYTVTGFKLGGHGHAQLKLFTSVGHVLQYQRGQGLSVFDDSSSDNSTASASPSRNTRKLLQQTIPYTWLQADENILTTEVSDCIDNTIKRFIDQVQARGNWVCTVEGCSWNSRNWGHTNLYLTRFANCWHVSGESMAGDLENAMSVAAESLQFYLNQWTEDQDVIDTWAAHPNELCILHAPAVAALSTDPPNYGMNFQSDSCPYLSSAVSGLVGSGSALLGNDGGKLDEDSCDGWGISGCVSVDAYANDDELLNCMQSIIRADAMFIRQMAMNGQLGAYIDANFDSVDAYVSAVTETIQDSTITAMDLLAPFGVAADLNTLTASVTTAMAVDPANLTPDQADAVAAAKDLLLALKDSLADLAHHQIKDCIEQNAIIMTSAAVPLVRGAIQLLSSESFRTFVHNENMDAMALSGEIADTQTAKCGEAGITLWWCANAERPYYEPFRAGACDHPRECFKDPVTVCKDQMHMGLALVSNAECNMLQYHKSYEMVWEGVTDVDSISEDNVHAVYNAEVDEIEFTDNARWECSGIGRNYPSNSQLVPVPGTNYHTPSTSIWRQFLLEHDCDIPYLAMDAYDHAMEAWLDVVETLKARDILDNSVSGVDDLVTNMSPQTMLSRDATVILHGVFEYAQDAQEQAHADFSEWKRYNNWDIVRSVENKLSLDYFGTNILTAEEQAFLDDTYGCTTQPLAMLHEASTVLSVMAVDACSYTSDNHRRPFFSGTMFSVILGAFDGYSLFLPPKYCISDDHHALPGALGSFEKNWWQAAYQGRTMDYVIMLHGWGGSSSFLFSAAAVMHYAFSGVAPADLEGNHDFNACVTWSDVMGSGCGLLAYPGGFTVLAPDGAAVPLGQRMWWMNSEFTGFVMDYFVFELPNYMINQLGMSARSIGIFGFSMGAFGALAAVNTYTNHVAAVYSANAPLYPSDCFFAYTCHLICETDIVFCELLFTSFGQILNSYVILWQYGLVVSTGSLDPIGSGIAEHMRTRGSAQRSNFVQCTYYRYLEGTDVNHLVDDPHTAGQRYQAIKARGDYRYSDWYGYGEREVEFLDTVVGDYMASLPASGGGCTYQNWESTGNTCAFASATNDEYHPTLEVPNTGSGSSVHSAHAALTGFDTTGGQFFCEGTCDVSFMNYQREGMNYMEFHGLWNSWSRTSDFYNAAGEQLTDCFAYACPSIGWCLEPNLSAGSMAYLDPVKSLVGAMKFVPFSNVVYNTVVPSAFSHFWYGMPLVKFLALQHPAGEAVPGSMGYNSYAVYPTLFYIHCSQNDEMGLYGMHIEFVALLLGGMASVNSQEYVHDDTKFMADFEDCDGHFFTLTDMWDVIGWYSDVFHSFVRDDDSSSDYVWSKDEILSFEIWIQTPQRAHAIHGVALCWVYGHDWWGAGIGGAFASSPQPTLTFEGGSWSHVRGANTQTFYLHTEVCNSGVHMRAELQSKIVRGPSQFLQVFTEDEWHNLEMANEADVDEVNMLAVKSAAEQVLAHCAASGIQVVHPGKQTNLLAGAASMERSGGDVFNPVAELFREGNMDFQHLAALVESNCP
jgi:hypothetical protein